MDSLPARIPVTDLSPIFNTAEPSGNPELFNRAGIRMGK